MTSSEGGGGADQGRAARELGVTLRRLRRGRGLSQRDLTGPLHVGSHSAVVAWEAGRRLPPAHILAEYERVFGLPSGRLIRLREQALAERAAADARIAMTGGAPSAGPTPRQLPAAAPDFVGRSGLLAELDRLLRCGSGPEALVISAIGGMAGVGKTALAVRFAHQIAAEFPDGQLYVNLRGFDPAGRPVSPEAAIRGFLDALDVPGGRIPPEPDVQAGLYRSLLAGRRMLILADNALDAAQVRPLLPGAPGCLVLVTSRRKLSGLAVTSGARLVDLDVLSGTEACELLAARIGAERVEAEPGPADEIIKLCGRLPLALTIAAARAAARPCVPLSALAAELREAPLDALAGANDPAADVRAVFSWSYHALSPEAARLFRLLGLHPGPDISTPAAASLAGRTRAQARPLLAELERAHLIGEHTPGRYACHDLLRAYARDLARARGAGASRERAAARRRLLDHYVHSARAAALTLGLVKDPITVGAPAPGVHAEAPASRDQALAWFAAERPVLLATVDLAASSGHDARAWQLASAMEVFLDRHGYWHEQTAAQQTALASARRLGDPRAQALAHHDLAHAYARLGRLGDADTHLRHALRIYGQISDQAGQARAHNSLCLVFGLQGRPADALSHARQAHRLYRAAGHLTGQGTALNNIGWACISLGDHRQALTHCEQALTVLQQAGDRAAQAAAWDSLGLAHHHLGHHDQAVACYQHAIALDPHTGDRYFHADTLARLGETHHAAGRPDAARDAWQQALAILDDLGHPDAGRIRAKLAVLPR